MLKLNYTYYSGDAVFPSLLKKNFIAPLTVVLRRSIIDRVGFFDETYPRSEDWEYWVRLGYHGATFYFLPEILAKSRIHPGSMSSGWQVKTEEKKTTLDIFEALNARMSAGERKKYHMGVVLFWHRVRLWYTYIGNHFPPLQWYYAARQRKRLKENEKNPGNVILICVYRDGTINLDENFYLGSKSHWRNQLEFLPGVVDGIKILNGIPNAKVVIVTNQSGVALQGDDFELLTEQRAREVNEHIIAELSKLGARIDGYRMCPYVTSEYAKHAAEKGREVSSEYVKDDASVLEAEYRYAG